MHEKWAKTGERCFNHAHTLADHQVKNLQDCGLPMVWEFSLISVELIRLTDERCNDVPNSL